MPRGLYSNIEGNEIEELAEALWTRIGGGVDVGSATLYVSGVPTKRGVECPCGSLKAVHY